MTPRDYAGASGKLALPDLPRLDARRWQVQRKIDGCYAVVCCDGDGRVAEVLSRTGKPYSDRVHRLTGELVGAPWSMLVGELEAHTDAGKLAAERNAGGLPRVHLFDAIQVANVRIAERPYSERRDALRRMHAILQEADPGRDWERGTDRRAHDRRTGRWCHERLRGWQRAPVLEQYPLRHARQLWDDYVERENGEGLVVVRQDAPLGLRGSKRKIKVTDTLDVVVIEPGERRATVHWLAADLLFTVGTGGRELQCGEVWEVAHNGFYRDGCPRFGRLLRERSDLR